MENLIYKENSDGELQKLKDDIQQLNLVLGDKVRGDSSSEEFDSDSDEEEESVKLENDFGENHVTQDLTRDTECIQLPGVSQSSGCLRVETGNVVPSGVNTTLPDLPKDFVPVDTDIPASPEFCLQLNLAYQRMIEENLKKLQLIQEQNKQRQIDIDEELTNGGRSSTQDKKRRHYLKYFNVYFKDDEGRCPLPNDETVMKRNLGHQYAHKTLPRKWTSAEIGCLHQAICSDGMKQQMQPLMNRLELLQQKLPRLPSEEKQAIKQEIEALKDQLDHIKYKSDSELIGDRWQSRIDWDKISVIDFNGERSPSECQLAWQNRLHPSISNKSGWTKEEDQKLRELVGKHNETNWELVAKELATGRSGWQCIQRYQGHLNDSHDKKEFTPEEDKLLMEIIDKLRVGNIIPFTKVAYFLEGHSANRIQYRWRYRLNPDVKKGKWSQEEDEILRPAVELHGHNWKAIHQHLPERTCKQIRDRWLNAIQPNIKKGEWEDWELEKLRELVKKHGSGNWVKISTELPHRRPNSILLRYRQLENIARGEQQRKRGQKRKEDKNDGDATEKQNKKFKDGEDKVDNVKKDKPVMNPDTLRLLAEHKNISLEELLEELKQEHWQTVEHRKRLAPNSERKRNYVQLSVAERLSVLPKNSDLNDVLEVLSGGSSPAKQQRHDVNDDTVDDRDLSPSQHDSPDSNSAHSSHKGPDGKSGTDHDKTITPQRRGRPYTIEDIQVEKSIQDFITSYSKQKNTKRGRRLKYQPIQQKVQADKKLSVLSILLRVMDLDIEKAASRVPRPSPVTQNVQQPSQSNVSCHQTNMAVRAGNHSQGPPSNQQGLSMPTTPNVATRCPVVPLQNHRLQRPQSTIPIHSTPSTLQNPTSAIQPLHQYPSVPSGPAVPLLNHFQAMHQQHQCLTIPMQHPPSFVPMQRPPSAVPIQCPPSFVPMQPPSSFVPMQQPPSADQMQRLPSAIPMHRPPSSVPKQRPQSAIPMQPPPSAVRYLIQPILQFRPVKQKLQTVAEILEAKRSRLNTPHLMMPIMQPIMSPSQPTTPMERIRMPTHQIMAPTNQRHSPRFAMPQTSMQPGVQTHVPNQSTTVTNTQSTLSQTRTTRNRQRHHIPTLPPSRTNLLAYREIIFQKQQLSSMAAKVQNETSEVASRGQEAVLEQEHLETTLESEHSEGTSETENMETISESGNHTVKSQHTNSNQILDDIRKSSSYMMLRERCRSLFSWPALLSELNVSFNKSNVVYHFKKAEEQKRCQKETTLERENVDESTRPDTPRSQVSRPLNPVMSNKTLNRRGKKKRSNDNTACITNGIKNTASTSTATERNDIQSGKRNSDLNDKMVTNVTINSTVVQNINTNETDKRESDMTDKTETLVLDDKTITVAHETDNCVMEVSCDTNADRTDSTQSDKRDYTISNKGDVDVTSHKNVDIEVPVKTDTTEQID